MLKKIYLIAIILIISLSAFNQTISITIGNKNYPFKYAYTKVKTIKDANYGMVFIPGGNLKYTSKDKKTQKITISPFWIDQNEVTNFQYRMFVEWVRDSIAMRLCIQNGLYDLQIENNNPNLNIQFYDPSDPTQVHLNWKKRMYFWRVYYSEVNEATRDMFFPTQDNNDSLEILDTRKLVYEYWYTDVKQVSQKNIKYVYDDFGKQGQLSYGHYGTITDSSKAHFISYDFDNYNTSIEVYNRQSFVQHKKVAIFPDTLVFMKYYSTTYNEPIVSEYFCHPAYNNYPVVGVSWEQANAFCHWRTEIIKHQLAKKSKNPPIAEFRLPTEAEWEFASRGGLVNTNYPWGDDDPQNRCNFVGAGFKKPTIVRSYSPNNLGLYDMAGNVAEWTSTNYDNSKKNKIIKGGSWNDNKDFIKNSSKTYKHIDSANVFVGFRCIRSIY